MNTFNIWPFSSASHNDASSRHGSPSLWVKPQTLEVDTDMGLGERLNTVPNNLSRERVSSALLGLPRASHLRSSAGQEHPRQGALYNKDAWLEALIAALGDVNLPRLPLLWSTLFTLFVIALELMRRVGWLPAWVPKIQMPADAHSFVAPPLGFLLVFRLSNAYERWSEGRLCFGKITVNLRLLAGQFSASMAGHDEVKLCEVTSLLKAFIFATRDYLRSHPVDRFTERASGMLGIVHKGEGGGSGRANERAWRAIDILRWPSLANRGPIHLRGMAPWASVAAEKPPTPSSTATNKCDDIEEEAHSSAEKSKSWKDVLSPEDAMTILNSHHGPLQVAEMIRREALLAGKNGTMADTGVEACHEYIAELMRGIAGCERILTTRMPFAFVMHLRAVLVIFLCTLPLVMLGSLGPALALPAQLAVSYAMLGTEAAAVNCEEPFGYDLNDLPMNKLCQELTDDLDEILIGYTRRAEWHTDKRRP